MGFLSRIDLFEPVDTWFGMERAAEERLLDGLTLAISEGGRTTGAIYLLGYVVEMRLKTAYFRYVGLPQGQDLGSTLKTVRNHLLSQRKNLHDLTGWMDLLIHERAMRGDALDATIANQLDFHVRQVYDQWKEVLRYRYSVATDQELNTVFASTEWIVAHHSQLWS